ncbi:MAG: hypothetical protein ABSE64_10750 [Vulcanimicrobiaceae bacterium]|jgi:hypothetical protein
MLRCSLVATNVLGFNVDVIEIDPDAKSQACDRETNIAAEVTH